MYFFRARFFCLKGKEGHDETRYITVDHTTRDLQYQLDVIKKSLKTIYDKVEDPYVENISTPSIKKR